MKKSQFFSAFLLTACVGVYGSDISRPTERLVQQDFDRRQEEAQNISLARSADIRAFEAINKKQDDFLKDLQSNKILLADLSKVDDTLDRFKLEATKEKEAKLYLEKYLTFVNSLVGNDLERAIKEYAERNYTVLQEVLTKGANCNVLKLQLELQDFTIQGRNSKYPKLYGYKIRD